VTSGAGCKLPRHAQEPHRHGRATAAGETLAVSGSFVSASAGGNVTTPPDFGGHAIEQGIEEDLGAPPERPTRASHPGPESTPDSDNEAHAAGKACGRCGAVITAGQDARRRADGQWVHEVCPGQPAETA
jgi:hypothetical protein